MARVTIEDCTEEVASRFELVSLAAQRAKAIGCGAHITLDKDNDKNAVIALREIAAKTIDINHLREDLIASLQTRNKVDVIEDENLHAENQEALSDQMDLSEDSIDMFDHNDHMDIESDAFDDNIEENR